MTAPGTVRKAPAAPGIPGVGSGRARRSPASPRLGQISAAGADRPRRGSRAGRDGVLRRPRQAGETAAALGQPRRVERRVATARSVAGEARRRASRRVISCSWQRGAGHPPTPTLPSTRGKGFISSCKCFPLPPWRGRVGVGGPAARNATSPRRTFTYATRWSLARRGPRGPTLPGRAPVPHLLDLSFAQLESFGESLLAAGFCSRTPTPA